MIRESLLVFTADFCGDLSEVFPDVIKQTGKGGPVLALPVEPVEHLVGVIDGSHGLVRSGVDHPGPVVGTSGHCNSELEGSETGAGRGIVLEEVPDFLID